METQPSPDALRGAGGHTGITAGNAGDDSAPALRIVAGLGDPAREHGVLSALAALAAGISDSGDGGDGGRGGSVTVVARCLTADQVVERVHEGGVDVALLAGDLHRLRGETLDELARAGVATVVLASETETPRWRAQATHVLPLDASAVDVDRALRAIAAAPRPARRSTAPGSPAPASGGGVAGTPSSAVPTVTVGSAANGAGSSRATSTAGGTGNNGAGGDARAAGARGAWDAGASRRPAGGHVLVVISGHGAPGRTTVAVSLATALGASVPCALVDADLAGPSVAAYLNADTSRNLAMLCHAAPSTPGQWERALEQELQPLGWRSPYGVLLCGVPKLELRGAISAALFLRLLAELRQRYRYVVVDVGAELVGADAAVHRAVVQAADRVLFVAAADAVGLWHARQAWRLLHAQVLAVPAGQRPASAVASVGHEGPVLILNRFDRRQHHDRREAERALGLPIAAVVPFDHAATQRAIEWQRPLVLDRRSRAGQALLDLAERLYHGAIVLPPEPAAAPHRGWGSVRGLPGRVRQLGHALRGALPAALPAFRVVPALGAWRSARFQLGAFAVYRDRAPAPAAGLAGVSALARSDEPATERIDQAPDARELRAA